MDDHQWEIIVEETLDYDQLMFHSIIVNKCIKCGFIQSRINKRDAPSCAEVIMEKALK